MEVVNEPKQNINTIEDVIYMSLKNDLSFIIGDSLNLYEHQSSSCGNLPLRGLFYLASIYRKYVKQKRGNIYGSPTIPLPLPQYLVFYNGTNEESDRWEVRLSDSFLIPSHCTEDSAPLPCLECTATVLNINYGHNRELMENCKKLKEYALFVAKIRKYTEQELTIREAIERAIEDCLHEDILTDILTNHREEVFDVILTEYDEAEHMEMVKTEGIAMGSADTAATILLKILSMKSEVPSKLRLRILAEKDLSVLEKWIDTALAVEHIADFEEQM